MRSHVCRSLLVAFAFLAFSACTFAQISIGISIGFPPPELPVYEQPLCPGDGYIWTPGYWAWDGEDYYWVPGTWVMPPTIGYFWTPPYWAWGGSGYIFHEGYWGPQVGFYGGINYGYGYFGRGYEGGRWDHGHFFYNREVNNVNVTVIHNVYNTRIVNRNESRVSYNGGNGGINVRASRAEEAAARQRHMAPVAAQTEHVREARGNPQFRASTNRGRPPIAATSKPAAFNERGAVTPATSPGRYSPPARPTNSTARPPIHPNDLPARTRPAPPSTGNPKTDQKYQQQQEKLYNKQQQDRQKLQQKQEQEHMRIERQQASDAKRQQVEQHHQQQTQQMQQRQMQQQQKMTQHQQPRTSAPPAHAAPAPAPRKP